MVSACSAGVHGDQLEHHCRQQDRSIGRTPCVNDIADNRTVASHRTDGMTNGRHVVARKD